MNRQELEYYARKYGLLLIILMTLVFALFPLFARVFQGAPITPGAQSYLYLRRADLLSSGSIGYDPLLQEQFAPNPYTMLLIVMQLFGVPWMLPVLLALLLIILLYYFLQRMTHDRTIIILILISLIISPTMHEMATTHNPAILALIFFTGAALLFRQHPIFGCVLIGALLLTSPILGIFASLLFLGYFIKNKRYNEAIGVLLAVLVAIAWFILWGGLPEISFAKSVFFEFGSRNGMSLFFIILAAQGIAVKFRKLPIIATGTIILVICTLFFDQTLPLTVVLLSIFVGHGIYSILTTKWELELLRDALIILICCIGIFIVITTIRERIAESPTSSFAHTMITLRNQHHDGGVLTLPEYAPIIEYFSGRSATFHDAVAPEIFSRDPLIVYPYLTQTNTGYILLTPKMKRLFKRSDDGVLFLIENGGRFVQVNEQSENELWYFIRLR